MNKLFPLALIALLAACSPASEEYHSTYFTKPASGIVDLFADQTQDSARVVSTDSWTLSSPADWFSLSPSTYQVPAGQLWSERIEVTADAPNTTGRNKQSSFTLSTSEGSHPMPVYHYSFLEILRPELSTFVGETFEERRPVSKMHIKPECTDTVIEFRIHTPGATLRTNSSWITPQETLFDKGAHTVHLALTPRTDNAARTGSVTLTSAGVTHDITLDQAETSNSAQ